MFHPEDETIVYASIGGQQEGSGFYISYDNGETWTASNSGIPDSRTISRMLFDISLSNTNIIYAVAYEPDTGNLWYGTYTNAYKSTDGGLNWQQISEGVPLGGLSSSDGWYDMGDYCLCIAVDPTDSNHVYIGNAELHETSDGENFTPVRPYGNYNSGSIVHVDYHKLDYAPSDPAFLLIGCDGGIYNFDTEQEIAYSWNQGLETFQFYRMGSHPFNPNVIIGGLQDNGTVVTRNGGDAWVMEMRGDGMECFFDHTDPNIVYASYYNGKLTKSSDGGHNFSTWQNMNGAWVTPFFMHPVGHDTLYSAKFDLYRYPRDIPPYINSWRRVTTDLMPVLITSMAQSKVNPDHMILAGCDESVEGVSTGLDTIPVMVSSDGGYTWTNVTANIPGEIRWISRVITDPNDENSMYIVRCGFSDGNKIYKTTDLGETWTNISGDLPDIPCNTMFINPEIPNHYYIGTDLGVYLSQDGGENYYYSGDGMPLVPIQDFDYVQIGSTGYLRVATYGRSIYETIFIGVDIAEKNSHNVNSLKIHPNPSFGISNIRYQVPVYSLQFAVCKNVDLNIYDINGQEILTLVNEKQPPGEYSIRFDGSGLPAGVYLVRLQAGVQVETAKLIVMK